MAKKTAHPTKTAVSPTAAAPAAAPKAPDITTRAAPPASRPVATSPVEKAAPDRKAATAAKSAKPDDTIAIKPEARWQMISEAAYFLAEKRGFTGGDPCQDWIDAEAQVEATLKRRGASKR